jgi:tetratricopeptide (TPR) repeat protein
LGSNFSFEAVLALPIAFVSDEVDAAEKIEALVKHSVLSPKWGRAGMSYHLPEVFRTQLSKSATSDTIREVISCFVAWGVATASVILNSTSPDLAVRPYLDELTFAAEHALEVADTESAAWLIRATRKSWIADEVPYPALTLIERMLALVPPGSELEAEIENSRAIFLGMLNRVAEADAAYLRAQEVYSQLGNAVRVLITLHNRGILKFTGGDYDGAETLLKQALEAAHEEGDEHLKRSCLAHLSIVKFTCDSEAEALQFESEFESLNGAEDSDLSNFLIEHKLLHLLIERRLSEAAPLLRKLISEPSHTENDAPLARLAFLYAVYLHQIGEHDLALRGVNQVFSFLGARGIDPKLNNQKLFGLMAKLFTSDELKSTTKPPTREEIQTFLEGFLNHLLT